MLGDGGEDVNGEAVSLREVNGDKLHPRIPSAMR
jgi:hypothetical protein